MLGLRSWISLDPHFGVKEKKTDNRDMTIHVPSPQL